MDGIFLRIAFLSALVIVVVVAFVWLIIDVTFYFKSVLYNDIVCSIFFSRFGNLKTHVLVV